MDNNRHGTVYIIIMSLMLASIGLYQGIICLISSISGFAILQFGAVGRLSMRQKSHRKSLAQRLFQIYQALFSFKTGIYFYYKVVSIHVQHLYIT